MSILFVAASAVAARQSADPQSGTESAQGAPAVLPGIAVPLPEAPPDILWTSSIAAAPITSPLIAGEYVVLSRLPGVVGGHRLSDGVAIWQKELRSEQQLVADGTMVFVASGEAIYALRLTDGAVAWTAPAGTLSAPLLVQGGWVIAASAAKLMAFRAADGTVVWTIDAPAPQKEAAAISGDTLFVPSTDGMVRARRLETGAPIWERQLRGQPGEPVVFGDSVLMGASDKVVYKLNATSGEVDWIYRVGATIRGRVAADGERVFVAALDNMIRAFDLRNGEMKWQVGLAYRPLTGPVVAGSTVFITGPGTDIEMRRTLDGAAAGAIKFPARLAVPPGLRESEFGVAIAAITGGLEESWNLLATRPVRALLTAPRPK